MINYNVKLSFPQVIVWEQKYGNSYYVANNLSDIVDISLNIVNKWIEGGYLDFLKDQVLPEVNDNNEKKAKATPWQYAPNTKFDQIKNILSNIEELERGNTPDSLEEFFKKFENYREKWNNVDYWKLKAIHIINDYSQSEYMNVFSETAEKFEK